MLGEEGEELGLFLGGVGEVVGVGDVADGFEGVEEGGLGGRGGIFGGFARNELPLAISAALRFRAPSAVAEEALGEGAEFELGEEVLDRLVVAGGDEEVLPGDVDGGVDDDGGEILREQGLVGVGLKVLLLLALQLGGVGEEVFD